MTQNTASSRELFYCCRSKHTMFDWLLSWKMHWLTDSDVINISSLFALNRKMTCDSQRCCLRDFLHVFFFFFFYQHKVLRLLAVLFDWQVQCGNVLSTSVEKDEKQWKICPPLSIVRRVIRWNFNTHPIQWPTDKGSKISKCSPSNLFLLIAFPALLPFQTGWYVSWHEIQTGVVIFLG